MTSQHITNWQENFFDSLKSSRTKEFITLEKSAHYPNKKDFEEIIEKMIEVSKSSS